AAVVLGHIGRSVGPELFIGHRGAITMPTRAAGFPALFDALHGLRELRNAREFALLVEARLGEPKIGQHLVAQTAGLPGEAHQLQYPARLPAMLHAPGAARQAP